MQQNVADGNRGGDPIRVVAESGMASNNSATANHEAHAQTGAVSPAPRKRRRLLPYALASTALGMLGINALRRDYLATWGTLDSPRYRILNSPILHDAPPTYYSRSEERRFDAPDEWVKARLPQIARENRSALLREVVAHPQLSIDLESHLQENYGTPLKCARMLFERVTGQPLPDSTHVLIVDKETWPSTHYSGSNHLAALGVSLVQKQSYLDTLMTIVHELGHQVCPVGESLVFELSGAEFALAREEACAYCFEYACILQLEDCLLRDVLAGYFAEQRDRLVLRFQQGADDEHSVGMALFDVALSLYPPDTASMQLSAGATLSGAIKARLEELRKMPLLPHAEPPVAP